MRTKNHHLLQRGSRWHFKIRIPADVLGQYPSRSPFIEEALKTTDVTQARKLRDQRVDKYERLWTEMRLRQGKDVVGVVKPLQEAPPAPEDISATISHLGDRIDEMAVKVVQGGSAEALDIAREEVTATGEGARLWREIQVLQGKLTPMQPYCEEWLLTKGKRGPKTLSDYRLALRLLTERFPNKEDVTWQKARGFLTDLSSQKAKDTVQKYTIAIRGVWEHNGWDRPEMWSVSAIDSSVDKIKVRPFTDDQFIMLMDALQRNGKRKLWLAAKIAAYTGASLSGICGLEARGFDGPQPSIYLPETKKEWRTRIIPCHPAIRDDVLEWSASPLANQTVTNQFSLLKTEMGLGPEHRFHSFRHSVVSRLENARVSDREIKRLVGHLIGSITFDTYSAEGLGYEVLADVVGRIAWPSVVFGKAG